MLQSNKYTFQDLGTYMGVTEYRIIGDGAPYRVRVRHHVSAYERSISCYKIDDLGWNRDVVAMIGLLCSSDRELTQPVVDAFNAWALAEHEKERAEIESHPEIYGVVDWEDASFHIPKLLRGANWQNGSGWVVIGQDENRESV